eukprot:CAMPEP_0172766348 /NCGR_PEP_ID=MMETSP1074-20121228/181027_1 /TAXON_ID=2916 /ORGANISM="Ceratium fusus, Strain PA161109" /LENGTH=152 /DNA_ID=CAMNT_0013601433 /DNA_START=33 /DNA_END=488 /DNA_ORIENTATION=+
MTAASAAFFENASATSRALLLVGVPAACAAILAARATAGGTAAFIETVLTMAEAAAMPASFVASLLLTTPFRASFVALPTSCILRPLATASCAIAFATASATSDGTSDAGTPAAFAALVAFAIASCELLAISLPNVARAESCATAAAAAFPA